MYVEAHLLDQAIQRLESRQLKALCNTLLDCYIDEISGIAHGIGGLAGRLLDKMGASSAIRLDVQIGVNTLTIAHARILS